MYEINMRHNGPDVHHNLADASSTVPSNYENIVCARMACYQRFIVGRRSFTGGGSYEMLENETQKLWKVGDWAKMGDSEPAVGGRSSPL